MSYHLSSFFGLTFCRLSLFTARPWHDRLGAEFVCSHDSAAGTQDNGGGVVNLRLQPQFRINIGNLKGVKRPVLVLRELALRRVDLRHGVHLATARASQLPPESMPAGTAKPL